RSVPIQASPPSHHNRSVVGLAIEPIKLVACRAGMAEVVVIRPERYADQPVIAEVVRIQVIRDALGRAKDAGEPVVMVEGIPAYYPRFGFEQASPLGFISPHPKIPDDAFMVKRLPGYSPSLAGRIVCPAAFDALGY